MTEPGDRDERITNLQADVAALESRLGRAEQDAAAARFLAGGADRDGAETRRELREFREEARTEFAGVRAEFADVRAEMRGFRDQNNRVLSAMRADMVDGFRQVDDKFTEIRGVLDGQAAWNQRLADMLGVLIHLHGGDRPEQ